MNASAQEQKPLIEAYREGQHWGRQNIGTQLPNRKIALEKRMEQYRQAWGDDRAHQFWSGVRDCLKG